MGRVKQSADLLEEKTDLKVKLKITIAAKELQKTPDEVGQRYTALLSLLPDFEQRLVNLPQAQVTQLLTDVNVIAVRMVCCQFCIPRAACKPLYRHVVAADQSVALPLPYVKVEQTSCEQVLRCSA